MKIKIPASKPRNPVAMAASKRSAGAHDKSNKAKRQANKLALKRGQEFFPALFLARARSGFSPTNQAVPSS